MKVFRFQIQKIIYALFLAISMLQLSGCKDRLPTDPSDRDDLPAPNKPVESYRRLKMQWAPTDYRDVFYDAQGRPVRLVTEALYIQDSNVTKKIIYDFLYGEDGKLAKLALDHGSYVVYTYEGNKLKTTQEYAKSNQLLTTNTYHYTGDKLSRVLIVSQHDNTKIQLQYFYDDRGNLNEEREYYANETTGEFDKYSATRYEKFDNKLNVENLWFKYPFVPGLIVWHNNYGSVKITV
jgi:hypothetical protein